MCTAISVLLLHTKVTTIEITSQESSPIVRRCTTCYNGGMVASVEVISKRPAIHGDQNHTQEFRVKYYLYEDAERYDTLEDALVKACDFDG